MKRESILSQLWAVIVGFSLSFGGVSAMVTAFSLEDSLTALVFGCVILAALATILMRFRFGWLGYSALLALMLLSKKFWFQGHSLLFEIGSFYSRGYGFSLPKWILQAEPSGHILPLLLIAGIVIGVAVWTILRRRRAYLAVGVGLLPLISCLIVTVTVPDNFAIVFLLSALALLILTQSTRRQDSRQGNRLCTMLALPIVAGLLLLMALVPRESYRPIRFPAWMSYRASQTIPEPTYPASTNKLNPKVDLTREGYRKLSKYPVMGITTDFTGKLYLRGRHYDTYTGTAWNSSLTRQESGITPSGNWISENRYSITILYQTAGDYRHIPYYPKESHSLNGGMVLGKTDGEYTYQFSPLWENWPQRWRELPETMPQEQSDYLYLPKEIMDWSGKLTNQFQKPYEDWDTLAIAEAVKNYVRNSATYDLDTPIPPDGTTDFVRWFLEESDTGYCVHFASAATVLLRASGVPARYVEGYALEVNAPGKTTVRGDMAHAWVEYYVNGLGWVILDPTPADTAQPTPPATTTPVRPTEPTTPEAMQPPSGSTAATAPTITPAEPVPEVSRSFTGLIWALAGIVAGLVLLVAQWLIRRWWKLRRLRSGHPNRQALARYREAKQLAKLRKQPVPDELRTLAEKAKFSNHPLTRQELAEFDKYTASSIQALCQGHWYWHLLLRFVFALR